RGAGGVGSHERAQRSLGLVYLQGGDDALALKHLEKAEQDGTVLTGLITAALNLGRLDDLDTWLDKADRLDKPPAALRRARARAKGVLARRARLGHGRAT